MLFRSQQRHAAVDPVTLANDIRRWGAELGFQRVGISDVDLQDAEPRLLEWLRAGFHGEMDYMAKHGAKRARPAELVPGTVRVIAARLNYLAADAIDSWRVINDAERAFISRYALGRDYPAFRALGIWNARLDAPLTALTVQAVVTLALIIGFSGAANAFQLLVIFSSPLY